MKNKFIIAIGAVALTVAIMSGISYAWYTAYTQVDIEGVTVGNLDIKLDGNPIESEKIIPAEEGKRIDYKITNLSSREVIVQFKPGALTAYVMPDKYLYSYKKVDYVKNDKHEVMQGLTKEHKMNINGFSSAFEKLTNVPNTDVTYDLSGDWKFANANSDYLGIDQEGGNYYLLISEGDTAEGTFEIALTKDAGNKYQYSLFELGEASALATQYNSSAIASAYEGLKLETIIQP